MSIGELSVSVTARTQKARKDVNAFRSDLARMERGVDSAAKMIKKLAIAGASLVGLRAVGQQLGESLTAIDGIGKTSDKLGIATEKLIAFRFAAEETGVSSQTFDMALQRVVRRVAEAANGTGEAVGALNELDVSATKLAALSPDQQFAAIADAMQGVGSQSDRVRLAMKLFDSEGVALVNTLKLGSEGLSEYEKTAKRLGITLSREQVAKVELANDRFGRLKLSIGGLVQTITIGLAPAITQVSSVMVALIEQTDTWQAKTFLVGSGLVLAATTIPKVVAGITAMVSALKAWRTAQIGALAVMGPKGWAILAGGVLAAGAAVYGIGRAIETANDRLRENETQVIATASAYDKLGLAREKLRSKEPPLGSTMSLSSINDEIKRLSERNRILEIGERASQREKFVDEGATTTELFNLKVLQRQNDELKRAEALSKRRAELRSDLFNAQRDQAGDQRRLQSLMAMRDQLSKNAFQIPELKVAVSRGSREEFQLIRQLRNKGEQRANKIREKQAAKLTSIDTEIKSLLSETKSQREEIGELKTAIQELQFGEAV